jgi:hypothetical protein
MLQAQELLMLQEEKDAARVGCVLAERLEQQLRDQAAQLVALRERDMCARARADIELKDKARRMRRCVVCWDESDKDAGVACQAAHFMCAECFNSEVKAQVCMENLGVFKKAGLSIKCRLCMDSESESWLDIALLTRHLKEDGFLAYMRAREAVLVGEAMQQQEDRAKKQIQDLEQQIRHFAGGNTAILQHRKTIIEDILTLKCPRTKCRRAFVDFDGCFALTCTACRCGFCAYCLSDCGADAHRHVVKCPHNIAPGKKVSASIGVFDQAQRQRRARLLNQYLAQRVEVGMREALVHCMQRDLADLGIDGKALLCK